VAEHKPRPLCDARLCRGGRHDKVRDVIPGSSSAFLVFAERRLSLSLRSGAAMLSAIAFFWPTVTAADLIPLFAAYLFIDGALALAPGGLRLSQRRAWPLLTGGGINMATAGFVYFWPGMTLPLLIHAAALWAIASGATMALSSATLRDADGDYLFLLAGIAALLLGRALLSHPALDVVVLSTWIGLYALTSGILLLKLILPQHYRQLLD
jgi:uncharacterized membrane protein HdeD (DUF308 family)